MHRSTKMVVQKSWVLSVQIDFRVHILRLNFIFYLHHSSMTTAGIVIFLNCVEALGCIGDISKIPESNTFVTNTNMLNNTYVRSIFLHELGYLIIIIIFFFYN